MSQNNALRARFTDGALTTASGPKVITMCYDRLDRDLAGAIDALELNDVSTAHELLTHSQDIVHELLCMLDLDVWEHASALAAIYRYITQLLVSANVHKRVVDAREARHLLGEIGDAFRQAAVGLANVAGTQPREAGRDFSVRA